MSSFNRIDVPPYESYEKLYEKLLTAVEETCGFAVEWRVRRQVSAQLHLLALAHKLQHFYRRAHRPSECTRSVQRSHVNIRTLCHFWTAELLEANRGGAAGGGGTKEVFSTFFQCFEEAFLSFGFNKLWCHSEECRPRLQSASANHERACEQRRVPDELIDRLNSCFTFNHCRVRACMWESKNVCECACLCVPGMALSYTV